MTNTHSIAVELPAQPDVRPAAPRPGPVRQFLQIGAVVLLTLASYFIVSHFLLQSVQVVGRSMVPTLHDSGMYLLNRWIYSVRPPHRCDIVVLRDPLDNGFSVKRIVGLPGDSVAIKDGGVFVNGEKLVEPYLIRNTYTASGSRSREQTFKCTANHYLVLGDNRGNSVDGRSYGPIDRQNILGMLVY